MIRIIKVNYSVGQPEKVAVIVSDKNDDHTHKTLMRLLQPIDQWASVEYLEKYVVPAVTLTGHDITAIWNIDELIENQK